MFDSHIILKDGTNTVDFVKRAEELDLDGICFVSEFSHSPRMPYIPKSETLDIRRGTEIEYDYDRQQSIALSLSTQHFDYIINSVKSVDGIPLDDLSYYTERSRDTAYRLYLEKVFEALGAQYDFSVLGSLSYMDKYSYYPAPALQFREFPDLLDPMLMSLAFSGKGLEIDASAISVTGEISPSLSILKRYREFGGELITLASLSHNPLTVGRNLQKARDMLLSLGFDHYAVFKACKPVMYKL